MVESLALTPQDILKTAAYTQLEAKISDLIQHSRLPADFCDQLQTHFGSFEANQAAKSLVSYSSLMIASGEYGYVLSAAFLPEVRTVVGNELIAISILASILASIIGLMLIKRVEMRAEAESQTIIQREALLMNQLTNEGITVETLTNEEILRKVFEMFQLRDSESKSPGHLL